MASSRSPDLPHLHGLTVLIADDDDGSLEALSRFVRGVGRIVLQVRSAMGALAYIDSEPQLDVLITDIRMPDIDEAGEAGRAQRSDQIADAGDDTTPAA